MDPMIKEALESCSGVFFEEIDIADMRNVDSSSLYRLDTEITEQLRANEITCNRSIRYATGRMLR